MRQDAELLGREAERQRHVELGERLHLPVEPIDRPGAEPVCPRQTGTQVPDAEPPQLTSFLFDADLSGWTALDVGCNGGFYSFELAKRGATVTSVDVDPKYLAQAQWAARQYGLEDRIRFVELSVYELASLGQAFDFVWFTGTFYHLRYPLLALDVVRTMTRKLLMFQSLTTPPGSETPEIPFDVRFDERDRLLLRAGRGWRSLNTS